MIVQIEAKTAIATISKSGREAAMSQVFMPLSDFKIQ